MKKFLFKQIDAKIALMIIIGVSVTAAGVVLSYKNLAEQIDFSLPKINIPFASNEAVGFKNFSSEEEFKDYLEKAGTEQPYYLPSMARGGAVTMETALPALPAAPPSSAPSPAPKRVSETNVQVVGIDEPDIVKTDGKEIYFAQNLLWRYWEARPVFREGMFPPYQQEGKVTVLKAFPPEDLASESKIDKSGDLLLSNNILVVFAGDTIYGYNVSNPKSPEEKWQVKLESNNYLVGARLYNNKIYLVTKTSISYDKPCPIKPLSANGVAVTIACQDIYHPTMPVPVDITFTASVLDPSSGKVEKTVSFVGSSGSSLIYVSEKAIYATYSYSESMVRFLTNFFKDKAKDIIPASIIAKFEKLDSYDISSEAKYLELQLILGNYENSLSDDESLKIGNELTNRMADYYKDHKRELEKTGIVKISLDGLAITAVGSVPGSLLNQFSLDEYNNNLRVAVTIGGGWLGIVSSPTESASDVYILDSSLKVQGAVKDLGLTERIYSVRFIEDKGYVVTFRQTDPFYVLDLSNPQNPQLKGELKIPGYSSYLDPIAKDRILGIGQENWQVKVSLFDVSSAANPIEKAKYILDEGWSEVLSNHHAFLADKKHQIFFLPGSRGGYVFSYKDDKLQLVKAVSGISAKRAIYIDDYLYIIGDNKIIVLNELNWERVKELDF